jgi:hypothetical protein
VAKGGHASLPDPKTWAALRPLDPIVRQARNPLHDRHLQVNEPNDSSFQRCGATTPKSAFRSKSCQAPHPLETNVDSAS